MRFILKIDLVDYKTVRVFLSPDDMRELSLEYETMDYSNDKTKRAVKTILHAVNAVLSLDLNSSKLFIEAFPGEEGDKSCILYISMLEKYKGSARRELSTPIVFSLNDIDSLSAMSERIFRQYSHLVLKSSLYLMDEKYMLMIYTYSRLDKKLIALASEYAVIYGRGKIADSFIREHAHELIASNAIETVVENLC